MVKFSVKICWMEHGFLNQRLFSRDYKFNFLYGFSFEFRKSLP